MRHWELGKVLSDEKFDVNIVCDGFDGCAMNYPRIRFCQYEKGSGEIKNIIKHSGTVIVDSLQSLSDYPLVTSKPLVADMPYPTIYETLEAPDAQVSYSSTLEELKSKLVYCDLLLCSNPRQKRMWGRRNACLEPF